MPVAIVDQLPTLGDLGSILQLTAGVSLAMSVFRAPYDHLYHKLGSILDREEIILRGRVGDSMLEQVERVLAARILWLTKGKELEPKIARLERWIWASIILSFVGLLATALWPGLMLERWESVAIIGVCMAPLCIGVTSINSLIRHDLAGVRRNVEAL